MKSQRRHELQHNTLSDWMGQKLAQIKPYSKLIIGVILAAILLIIVISFVRARNLANRQGGWNRVVEATFSADAATREATLRNAIDSYPKTPAAIAAQKALADQFLAQGSQELFTNPLKAREDNLKKAETNYLAVLKDSEKSSSVIRMTALFGLAQTYEMLDNLPEAIRQYEILIETYPNSALASPAKQRARELKSKSGKEFYAALNDPLPKLPPPHVNQNFEDLPRDPDLELPSELPSKPAATTLPDLVLPEGPKKPEESTKPEEPKKPEETKQPEEPAKPAEPPKPADKQPETPAKPEDKKPAEPKPSEPPKSTEENKPAENKPAETKPTEPKPSEPKSEVKQPAEKPADPPK